MCYVALALSSFVFKTLLTLTFFKPGTTSPMRKKEIVLIYDQILPSYYYNAWIPWRRICMLAARLKCQSTKTSSSRSVSANWMHEKGKLVFLVSCCTLFFVLFQGMFLCPSSAGTFFWLRVFEHGLQRHQTSTYLSCDSILDSDLFSLVVFTFVSRPLCKLCQIAGVTKRARFT